MPIQSKWLNQILERLNQPGRLAQRLSDKSPSQWLRYEGLRPADVEMERAAELEPSRAYGPGYSEPMTMNDLLERVKIPEELLSPERPPVVSDRITTMRGETVSLKPEQRDVADFLSDWWERFTTEKRKPLTREDGESSVQWIDRNWKERQKEYREVFPSWEEEIEPYVLAAEPLLFAGGLPASYKTLQAIDAIITKGASRATRAALNRALDTGLDRWIATQGRLNPAQRSWWENWLLKDRNWLVERATDNMLKRMGKGKAVSQAASEAVDDTIRELDKRLLESGEKPPETAIRPAESPPRAIPEFGEADAGLQRSMLSEVPEQEVRTMGRGEITQAKLEDFGKLKEYQRNVTQPSPEAPQLDSEGFSGTPLGKYVEQTEIERLHELRRIESGELTEAEISQADSELGGLREWVQAEPAAKYTYLIKTSGKMKGEIPNLSLKQYTDVTGKETPPPNVLTTDKKHVKWEYVLDQKATELGYADGDTFREAILKVADAKSRISLLEKSLAAARDIGPAEVAVAWDKPKVTLTDQLQGIYDDIKTNLEATRAALTGERGEEAVAHRRIIATLQKELKNLDNLQKVVNVGKDVKARKQKINAIKAFKGIPDTQYRELLKKTTGISRLSSMTETQLKEVLDAVRKARPVTIRGKHVITQKTERAIQSLKHELINTNKLSEDAYRKIMRYLDLDTDKYVSAELFATETEGRNLIRQINAEAEVGLIEWDTVTGKALDKYPDVRKAVDDIERRTTKTNERYVNGDKPVGVSRWYDTRYYMMKLQGRMGNRGRFYDIWFRTNEKRLANFARYHEIWRKVEKSTPAYKKIANDEDALQRITDYIESRLKVPNAPEAPKNISPEEVKLAEALENIYNSFRNEVRIYRFKRAYESNKGNYERINEDIPDAPRKDIQEAVRIYESKGHDELVKYLNKKQWGVIESGYSPHIAVNPKLRLYKIREYVVGKGHLQAREGFEPLSQKDNILQRTQHYVRQILNLSLEPYFKAMDRAYFETAKLMDNPGQIKSTIEIIIAEMKGQLRERTAIVEYLNRVASLAYTSIFLRPSLGFRNLFQNSFHPNRGVFLNLLNRRLTMEEQRFVTEYVSQQKSFTRDILLLDSLGSGRMARFANAISYYQYSDLANRKISFWGSMNKAERALSRYHKSENVDNFIKSSGLNDLTYEQQAQTLRMLVSDKVDYAGKLMKGERAAVLNIARQITNNTHFMYDRAERAPVEMGEAARVIASLLTFSRSYAQRLYIQIGVLRPGSNASASQRVKAWKTVLGILVMGYAAGEIYKKVTGKRANPYDPTNILVWAPGGLPLGVTQDISEAIRLLIAAAQGEGYAMSELTTLLPSLGDTFIPFYDATMNILEAALDEKYIDRHAMREIQSKFDKDYKPNEEYYEENRGILVKIQHALFGGEAQGELAIDQAIKETKIAIESITDMAELGKIIRDATDGMDLDIILNADFPPIVSDFFEHQSLIEQYREATRGTEWEDQALYRKTHPEAEAALVIWEGFKTFQSDRTEGIVREFLREHNIPASIIPALQVENEKNNNSYVLPRDPTLSGSGSSGGGGYIPSGGLLPRDPRLSR